MTGGESQISWVYMCEVILKVNILMWEKQWSTGPLTYDYPYMACTACGGLERYYRVIKGLYLKL